MAEENKTNGIKSGVSYAQVFKTIYVPHRGKLNVARVWSGQFKEGQNLESNIRIQGLSSIQGQENIKISEANAGDVIGLPRLEQIKTGNIILSDGKEIKEDSFRPLSPQPIYSKAIVPIKREDDVKLSESLKEIAETDSSYIIERNSITQQLLLWGQGEIPLKNCNK